MLVPIAILVLIFGTAGAATGQFKMPVTKNVTEEKYAANESPVRTADLTYKTTAVEEVPLSPVEPADPIAIKLEPAAPEPKTPLDRIKAIEGTYKYEFYPVKQQPEKEDETL